MNPWIVFAPFLFQIVIALLIGLTWITFIRNVIKDSKKNGKDTQRNKMNRSSTPSTMKRSSMQSNRRQRVDRWQGDTRNVNQNQRTNAGRQESKDSGLFSLNSRNLVENLFKQTPQDLYRLLVNNLPERYHSEVKSIFSSRSWKRKLWEFVRRKDIWPLLQDSLRTEGIGKREANKSLSSSYRNDQKKEESSSFYENEAGVLDSDFEKEYDLYSQMYDDISNSLLFESLSPDAEEKMMVSKTNSSKKKEIHKLASDRKWLRNAILSKEILERPDF